MLQTLIDFRLDVVVFSILVVAASCVVHVLLRRRHERGMPRLGWMALATLVVVGAVLPEWAGEHERNRLRDMLSGIAPTYARELELMGHDLITEGTPPDDPRYLSMINAQIRWLQANTNVSDIYTFARRPDGKTVLMVDSETDYNKDGKYDEDRDQRTTIGEVYEEVTPPLDHAFEGVASFDGVPYPDFWGTWVSAFVPMHGPDGKVNAVLGVDYDARLWLGAIAMSRVAALAAVTILAVILLSSTVVVVVTQAELVKRVAAQKEREKLQAQLVAASRMAGMAEVATGVLHNVGNVLNSVNVSAEMLRRKLGGSKIGSLVKATTLIREQSVNIGEFLSNDPKGKLLPNYLVQLSELLSAEQDGFVQELTALSESVDHIKHIVAAQQDFARNVDLTEPFEIAPLFEDAIRINSLAIERHHIELVNDCTKCGPVLADRHKVLQILVNLISNAKNAVSSCDGPRRITVRAEEFEADDKRRMARITVTDTGVGITRENLPKIFTHGFTTRSDGHGFGLHTAAIAAPQMKGSLTAHSDGAGKGATFTLTIPSALERIATCK